MERLMKSKSILSDNVSDETAQPAIVQHAYLLARSIATQFQNEGSEALKRNVRWLDELETRHGCIMLLHHLEMVENSIYLGPELRRHIALKSKRALFAPNELAHSICPMDHVRVTAYHQHFYLSNGDDYQQVVKTCLKDLQGEWMVSFSVRVDSNKPYILTIFRVLGELLLLERFNGSHVSDKNPEKTERLSPREQQVLLLIAEGHSSSAIAEKLNISPLTVKTHRQALMAKLQVKNVAGLVRHAVDIKAK